MKTILLLPALQLPIPAIKGGAVEQLITYLLEENERLGKVRFVVISKYDKDAVRYRYTKSKVYYVEPITVDCKDAKGFSFAWIFYNLWCKIFKNSFCRRIFKRTSNPLGKYQYLCRYIAKHEEVDAISIEGQWELPLAHLNEIVGKENLYTHLHTSRPEDIKIRKLIKNSIAISEFVKISWTKDCSINGNNHVLYNAADIDKFNVKLDTIQRNDIRSSLHINSDDFVLLFCARIIPEKGIEQLLKAMQLLSHFPIKLLFIGSVAFSLNETSEFENKILQMAQNLANVIHLGYIHNDKLPLYYAVSDIQIVPSIWQEGAGIVSIEGMAAGLPLIVTQSGGMVEYVTDETAIKVPIDDNLPQNIANAVIALYNDPDRRNSMGKAGGERAKLFSKENYYNNFVKIFTE